MTVEQKGIYFEANRETSRAIGRSPIPPREQQKKALEAQYGTEVAELIQQDLEKFDEKLDSSTEQTKPEE